MREEAVAKCKPLAVLPALLGAELVIAATAWFPPLARLARFREPWLPMIVVALAACFSIAFWWRKGQGTAASVFTLLDTACYVAAVSLCAGLTASPISVAFAAILGLMVFSTQARDYSLTLPFALAVCVPSFAHVALMSGDTPTLMVVVVSCFLCLYGSYYTHVQRQLRQRNESLRQALSSTEQMADKSIELALSTTLLDVAHFFHELRNMQTAVALHLKNLDDEIGDVDLPSLRDALSAHESERQILEATIESLKRRSQGQRASFDLAEALDRALDQAAVHGTQVEFTGQVPHFLVESDAHCFEIVLENLLRNARQAGATQVEVSCQLDPSASFVVLNVKDDGPGLPMEAIGRLFEPFSSVGKEQGTGLGLYLTRRSVELMGGQIEAGNAEQGGALFRMRLPGRLHTLPPASGNSSAGQQ